MGANVMGTNVMGTNVMGTNVMGANVMGTNVIVKPTILIIIFITIGLDIIYKFIHIILSPKRLHH